MGFRSSRSIGQSVSALRRAILRSRRRKQGVLLLTETWPACIPRQRTDGRWDCMVRTPSGKLRLCATVGPFATEPECLAAYCH
ncbi:MAG: hypothetical protein ACK5VH_10975 [bacterium]